MEPPSQSDLVYLYLDAVDRDDGTGGRAPETGAPPRTVQAIGEVLELDRETTSQRVTLLSTLEELVESGMVTREQSETSARPQYRLTDDGQSHARSLRDRVRDETVTLADGTSVAIPELDRYFESYPLVRALSRLTEEGTIQLQDAVGREFVDREAELDRLQDLLSRVPQQGSHTVVVSGEAGLGKTTLVERFLDQAREDGFRVGTGRCRREGGRPYESLVDAFRELPDSDPLVAPLESASFEGDDHETFDAERTALFNEVTDALRSASESQPLVVFLDDLQWAGPDTRRLFVHLTRHLSEWLYPVLFVGTCRSEAAATAPEILTDLTESDRATHIELEPLPEADSHGLVAWLTGTPDLPEAFLDALRAGTGGNPLLVRETVQRLLDEGLVGPEADADALPTEPSALPTAPDVEAVIESRLADLPADTREVLAATAVADEAVTPTLVATVLDEATATVNDHLDVLVTGRFLERTGDSVAFVSGVVREAIVETLPADRRQVLHRGVASAIEATTDDPDEEAPRIAYHYEQAGEHDTALSYYRTAGDTARSVYAHEDALDAYERALELATECGDETVERSIHEQLGETAATLGAYERARTHFADARALTEETATRQRLFEKTGQTYNGQGDFEAAIEAAERGLDLGGDVDDPDAAGESAEIAGLLSVKASALRRTGDPDTAHEVATLAREHARAANAREREARVLGRLGNIAQARGNYDDAEEFLTASLDIARDHDETGQEASALKNLGIVAIRRGNLDDAQAYYEQGLSLTREVGNPQLESGCLHDLGYIAETRGNLDDAQAYYERSLAIDRDLGDRDGESHSLQSLGRVASDRGDADAAREYYEESLEINRETGDRRGEATSLYNLGVLAMNQTHLDDAEQYFEESIAINRETDDRQGESASRHNLGTIAQKRGNTETARRYYEESLDIQQDIGYQQGEATTHQSLGGLARLQGAFDRAESHLEQSGSLFREMGDRRGETGVLLDRGKLAMRRGEANRARENFQQAAEISADIDYPLGVAQSHCQLALAAIEQGAFDTAREALDESEIAVETVGATDCEATIHVAEARLALEQERYDDASDSLEDALGLAREATDQVCEIRALLVRARLHQKQGRSAGAVEAATEALEYARACSYRPFALEALGVLVSLTDGEQASEYARTALSILEECTGTAFDDDREQFESVLA